MSHIADVKFCFIRGLNRFENLTIGCKDNLLNHCKDEAAVFFLQLNAQTSQEFDSRAYFSDNLGKNMVIP